MSSLNDDPVQAEVELPHPKSVRGAAEFFLTHRLFRADQPILRLSVKDTCFLCPPTLSQENIMTIETASFIIEYVKSLVLGWVLDN